MNVYERPRQSLGVSLAEAWPESGEQSPLLFRQLGHIANIYDNEPVAPGDLVVIRSQLSQWAIDLNVSSAPVALAAREIDASPTDSLDLSNYNTDKRRRVKLQGDICVMLAKKPLLGSDAATLYYVESDVLLDSSAPLPIESEKAREAREAKENGKLHMSEQAAAITELLFQPREEIIDKLGLSVKALCITLSSTIALNDMTEREFFVAAFHEGRVKIPALPSTAEATFSSDQQAIFAQLPLPRKGTQLAPGRATNNVVEQLPPIYSKLGGIETPEQALFMALRDKHTS